MPWDSQPSRRIVAESSTFKEKGRNASGLEKNAGIFASFLFLGVGN
jgi:hypothetical protein